MSITSDEVNYLIYRYLLESGMTHSSFAFAHESQLVKSDLKNINVSPGALISYLQKGLLYAEAELHLTPDGAVKEFNKPISLLQLYSSTSSTTGNGDTMNGTGGGTAGKRKLQQQQQQLLKRKRAQQQQQQQQQNQMDVEQISTVTTVVATGKTEVVDNALVGGAASVRDILASSVLNLLGHTSEVFNARWHPIDSSLLVSGAGDSTARIWKLATPVDSKSASECVVLPHEIEADSKDVTALKWSNSGSLLATGTYTGLLKLWSDTGALVGTLKKHRGPIFAVAWYKDDSVLLSAGVDKSVVAWNPTTLEIIHVFSCHSAPVLDVDWKPNDDYLFATCSTDKSICVSRYIPGAGGVGGGEVKRFTGHTHEVNTVSWSFSGKYIASCSDDKTAKIWTLDNNFPGGLVADLKGHSKEIYTVDWSPAQSNDNTELLATASFDHSIRIWEIPSGKCIKELKQHTHAVYSVAFSPNGKYLASGGFDGRVIVWRVTDGVVLKVYKGGNGGIFEVAWSADGARISAAFSKSCVCVFEFKQ